MQPRANLFALVLIAVAHVASAVGTLRKPRSIADDVALLDIAEQDHSQKQVQAQTRVSASAGGTSAAASRLRLELAAATREDHLLRNRLAEVSSEAHQGVARLRKQLRLAEAIAQKSQSALRTKLQQATVQLAVVKKAELQLHQRLTAATQSESTHRAAAEKAAAQLRAQLTAVQTSRAQLTVQLAAAQAAQAKEASQIKAEEASQSKLRLQLAAAQKEEAQEASLSKSTQSQLRAQLKALQAESANKSLTLKAEAREALQLSTRANALQDAVNKENARIKDMTKLQADLKAQIAAAKKEEAKQGAMLKATEELRDKLKKQAEEAEKAKAIEDSKLKVELLSEQQLRSQIAEMHEAVANKTLQVKVMEAVKEQLNHELQTVKDSSAKESADLKKHLESLSQESKKTGDKLAAQKSAYLQLQGNMTKAASAAMVAAKQAHRDRLGLLEQISELQDEVQQAAKKAAAAENRTRSAVADAARQADAMRLQQLDHDRKQQREVAALQEQVSAARSNASALAEKYMAAKREVSSINQEVQKKDQELHAALLESTDIRNARDAEAQKRVSFEQLDHKAEASVGEMRAQLSEAKKSLSEAQDQLAAKAQASEQFKKQTAALQAKLREVQKQAAAAQAKAQEDLHATMLSAASKVRELQDKEEEMTGDLEKAQKALSDAKAESAQAKDTLVQETDAALRATRRADSLQSSLSELQKDADTSGSKVQQLMREVTELQRERSSAASAVQELKGEATQLQGKAEDFQKKADDFAAKAKSEESENKALRAQVTDLSVQGQRADALAQELSELRAAAAQNATRESQLLEQMERLRDLKDHYSSEYEAVRNDSDSWRARAEDLDGRLRASQSETQAVVRQRDGALERVRSSRSEEDEYFEENNRLQQQNQALNDQLRQAQTVANNSAAETQSLRARVDELKADEARDQANSHAAWVANEKELMQARQDLHTEDMLKQNAEAELERTRSVLTDAQKKALGIPTGKQAPRAKPVPPAVLSAAPASVEANVVRLSVKEEDSAALHAGASSALPPPLTPQVKHLKTWSNSNKLPASHHAAVKLGGRSSAMPVKMVAAQQQTRHSEKSEQAKHEAAMLPGEPRRPDDDPAKTLASVTDTSPRSTLQKLAEYFASPVQH